MRALKLSIAIIIGCVSLALLIGCSRTAEQKVADAKANAIATKQDVNAAVADARANEQQSAAREEWLTFKSEAKAKVAANEKIIATYKARMTEADGNLRAEYDKKMDALDKKNKELRISLDDYHDSGKVAWERFKSGFDKDMDELGAALTDFTADTKK
jgi:hypothetical protein